MKLILITIPVILIFAASYFFLQSDFFKPREPVAVVVSTITQTPTPITTTDETANWKTYLNEKYGFGFRYPFSWGELQEKTVIYGPNEYERGKRLFLIFSKNSRVRASGLSSDFTRPMEGGDDTFGGDPQKPKGISSSIYVGLPGCEERYAQSYNGWVEFNLPGKEISGFRLILPILSQAEIEKFSRLYPISGDGFCPVGSKELEQAKQHAEDILKKIETGDIDKESRENLQIFREVVKSAYVF